jgi:hypothetical protein
MQKEEQGEGLQKADPYTLMSSHGSLTIAICKKSERDEKRVHRKWTHTTL